MSTASPRPDSTTSPGTYPLHIGTKSAAWIEECLNDIAEEHRELSGMIDWVAFHGGAKEWELLHAIRIGVRGAEHAVDSARLLLKILHNPESIKQRRPPNENAPRVAETREAVDLDRPIRVSCKPFAAPLQGSRDI